ncbi:hypothetical protein FQR65_LT14061 [Abscondita terminalis]|nr:hypothetical protein FQR65_LT14061 [Abscondita terminalis]
MFRLYKSIYGELSGVQNQEACDSACEEVNLHNGPTPNQIAQSKEIKSSIKILQNLVIPTTASSTLLDLAVENTGIPIDYETVHAKIFCVNLFNGIRGSTAGNESILAEGFSVLPSCESYETNLQTNIEDEMTSETTWEITEFENFLEGRVTTTENAIM